MHLYFEDIKYDTLPSKSAASFKNWELLNASKFRRLEKRNRSTKYCILINIVFTEKNKLDKNVRDKSIFALRTLLYEKV